MIQSTAQGMHIQTSKEKNVNLKSTQPRFLAGPFSVPTPFTEDEKKLILYLFDDKLAEMYDLVIMKCFCKWLDCFEYRYKSLNLAFIHCNNVVFSW